MSHSSLLNCIPIDRDHCVSTEIMQYNTYLSCFCTSKCKQEKILRAAILHRHYVQQCYTLIEDTNQVCKAYVCYGLPLVNVVLLLNFISW